MSRSAIELTRFTVTAPHAYAFVKTYAKSSALRNGFALAQSKNRPPQLRSFSSHRSSYSNASPSVPTSMQTYPPPSSETPAEKVARLRAARFKARMAQIPLWDRVVVEGRRWADRFHRITVYTLLLASILSFIVLVYTTADMIIWNRRKNRQYVKDQNILYQEAVTKAIEAESSGKELNEEQRLILGRERTKFEEREAEERRKKEPWWITKWLLSGLKMGDEDDEDANPGKYRWKKNEGQMIAGTRTTQPEAEEEEDGQNSFMHVIQEQQNPDQPQQETFAEPPPSPPLSEELETTPTTTPTQENNNSRPKPEQTQQPKRSWWSRK